MKLRISLLLLVSFSCFQLASAQKEGIRTATRIGVGASQFSSSNFQTTPSQDLQFEAGGMLLYGINKYIGIRADLKFMYTSVEDAGPIVRGGFVPQDYPSVEQYRYIGLGLPIQLRIAAPLGKISLYADGGFMTQANLLATEKRTFSNQNVQDNNGYDERKMTSKNAINFSVVYDLGVELDAKGQSYFLEASFFHFLSPLGKVSDNEVNLRGFSIGGGILF